jgi:hypothetical protein
VMIIPGCEKDKVLNSAVAFLSAFSNAVPRELLALHEFIKFFLID